MKISEMTNEQAADSLVRIAEPIGRICDDERIMEMLNEYRNMAEMPMIKAIGKFLPQIATVAMKEHRDDLFEIVGALTMQSREKAGKMNFLETVKVIREALNDEAFTGFFTSFKAPENGNDGELSQA